MTAADAAPFVFIIAGEPSGDALGAALIRALARAHRRPDCGSPGSAASRCGSRASESLVPLSELAVAGLAEVLPHAPRLLRRIRETVAAIRAMRPDAVVTIDSSGFCWRVAHVLRRRGETLPLIAYVAPMVWAWRPGRARHMARWYDHVLTLLPFEPPYFEKVGLAAIHVGHPVLESGAGRGDAARFRTEHGIADRRTRADRAARQPRRRGAPAAADLRRGAGPARPASSGRSASRFRPSRRWPKRSPRGSRTGPDGRSCLRGSGKKGRRKNTTPSPRAAPRSPPRARSRSNWRWPGCRWRSPIA